MVGLVGFVRSTVAGKDWRLDRCGGGSRRRQAFGRQAGGRQQADQRLGRRAGGARHGGKGSIKAEEGRQALVAAGDIVCGRAWQRRHDSGSVTTTGILSGDGGSSGGGSGELCLLGSLEQQEDLGRAAWQSCHP